MTKFTKLAAVGMNGLLIPVALLIGFFGFMADVGPSEAGSILLGSLFLVAASGMIITSLSLPVKEFVLPAYSGLLTHVGASYWFYYEYVIQPQQSAILTGSMILGGLSFINLLALLLNRPPFLYQPKDSRE